jgi:predicted transcriptional regulator
MPHNRPPVSDAEREVLLVLWEHPRLAVREIAEKLAESGASWQRTTVLTLLSRLEKKGYIASDRSGHAYVYRAVVSRDELVHQRMQELANELCDGRPAPLLLAFAERQKFTAEEIAELQRLVEELAARQGKGKRR